MLASITPASFLFLPIHRRRVRVFLRPVPFALRSFLSSCPPVILVIMATTQHPDTQSALDRPAFKVADLSLAEFGRKELRLAEQEMPGLMRFATSTRARSRSLARRSWARCT
jgi:hypothetical protein